MFLTRLKAGAVVLLASCTMASQTTLATERAQAGRDDGGPIAALAAVASGDTGSPQDPAADAAARAKKPPEAGGDGGVRSKGRIFTPDGKLVYVNVYSDDTDADRKEICNFANVSVMPRLSRRIKGIGSPLFDVYSDVDGHPSAAFVLKQAPGSKAAEVIEAIKGELEQTKKESFPPGMNFEVIPLDSRDMIYAVIKTPRGATLEYTSDKCQELSAVARDTDEITSVSSLAGYQIRTEGRGPDVGTCLIHLKDRSGRKLTTRQIIETLEEKCRAINAHLEFFE